ncbi:MAG: tetratricopeptide repeat protein [Tepidisphaeraceae bacterium]
MPSHEIDSQLEQAVALQRAGRLADAESVCHRILVDRPDHALAWVRLGLIVRQSQRFEEAISHLQKAVELDPTDPFTFNDLARTLMSAGRVDEAVDSARRAVSLKPDLSDAHATLGMIDQQRRRLDDALVELNKAIELDPNDGVAHFGRATTYLLQGDFARGWPEYEWRRRMPLWRDTGDRLARPRWDGSDPRGRTILVYAEQGLGDSIHFARYVPMLCDRGARVAVYVQPPLFPLFRTLPGVWRLISPGAALPDFDLHTPLPSLPLAFGTTVDSIPANVPYLRADPDHAAKFKTLLGERDGRTRVGLCWAGNPEHISDRLRSMLAEALAPLAKISGVQFHSIQKDRRTDDPFPDGLALIDHASGLKDFADTAALIDSLDLVITVDTSVAHLAGAIGKPVCLMLDTAHDWRWLLGRDDSPWYPTMKLVRQPTQGDWSAVVAQIAEECLLRTRSTR